MSKFLHEPVLSICLGTLSLFPVLFEFLSDSMTFPAWRPAFHVQQISYNYSLFCGLSWHVFVLPLLLTESLVDQWLLSFFFKITLTMPSLLFTGFCCEKSPIHNELHLNLLLFLLLSRLSSLSLTFSSPMKCVDVSVSTVILQGPFLPLLVSQSSQPPPVALVEIYTLVREDKNQSHSCITDHSVLHLIKCRVLDAGGLVSQECLS